MADFTADFEGGVDGATITNGAGEASATAWTSVGGSPAYSNSHAHGGTLAGVILAANDVLDWTIPSTSDHYGRIYLYATAVPANYVRFVYATKGGVMVAEVLFEAGTGKLIVADKGEAHFSSTTTNAIALNQWVRIEWHVIHSATVGQVEVKLFNTPDSTTPTEVLTSPATWDTDTSADGLRFGTIGGGAYGSNFWLDDIVGNATAYPGPAAQLAMAAWVTTL